MKSVKKNTKIIATVGPASRSKEMLWELHQAGANIFRLNFSHGSHEDHKKVIQWVRELNEEHNVSICLLQDLQGPKIRTNLIENDAVEIIPGQILEIVADDFVGNAKRISTTYETIAQDVRPGDTILIDDGNLELKVKESDGKVVKTEVIFGGMLKSRKGINLPDTPLSVPSLTPKDREDLIFGIENDVDWIALSFVRQASDITELKDIIKSKGKNIQVISKIEKPEAIDNMDEIIEATDGLMVARGDLGVEIDMARVPMIQKELVNKCNKAGKPSIVATQMLESMVSNPRPTRAEANDVANALTDGADVVMLSAESAAGDFPVHSVSSMSRIIQEVEKHNVVYDFFYNREDMVYNDLSESLVMNASALARDSQAKAIVAMTESGYTANMLARHRPKADIFVFTTNKKLVTQLGLVWGVTAFLYEGQKNTDQTIEEVNNELARLGYISKGDVIVNCTGMPTWTRHKTNMLKISTYGD